jgi:colanic acid/amylovoran biosynthesis glycosyltransferase
VTFEGHVPYSKHLEALRGSDIFLAPSTVGSDGDTEGGAPVALIEAQAAGIPAVATRHCDIPEVVLDGRTGVLVAEKDAGALAAAIAELLRRPETWPEIGREARRHIEEEFDVKRQVAKTEELYLDVLDRARPAAGASR